MLPPPCLAGASAGSFCGDARKSVLYGASSLNDSTQSSIGRSGRRKRSQVPVQFKERTVRDKKEDGTTPPSLPVREHQIQIARWRTSETSELHF
jgi:hypothetical protein